MAPKRDVVYIVHHRNEEGGLVLALACSKLESAEAAAQKMQENEKIGVKVQEVTFIDATEGKKASTIAKKGKEKSLSSDDAIHDEDANDEEAATKPKKAAKKAPTKTAEELKAAREVVPDGEPGSLDGLKFVFTGTMKMNRKTMEAAAETYGGEVGKANKLDEADYIVLGTKPGVKKLEEIEEKSLKTMTEEQFLEMLKGSGEPAQGPAKKKLKT